MRYQKSYSTQQSRAFWKKTRKYCCHLCAVILDTQPNLLHRGNETQSLKCNMNAGTGRGGGKMKLKPERRVGWHAHKGPAEKRERCVPAEHGKEKREYVLSYTWGEMKTTAGQNRWPQGTAERTFKSDFVESQLLFFFCLSKQYLQTWTTRSQSEKTTELRHPDVINTSNLERLHSVDSCSSFYDLLGLFL